MNETLDALAARLCEGLPADLTLYEHEGACGKPTKECSYCHKNADETYFCKKKTYTPMPVVLV